LVFHQPFSVKGAAEAWNTDFLSSRASICECWRNGEFHMRNKRKAETFPSAFEDARAAEVFTPSPQTLSPSYRLAYMDHDFLLTDQLRPVRLQLELLKPELILTEHEIGSTIVIFGSTRTPEPKVAYDQMAEAEAAAKKDPTDSCLARKARIAGSIAVKSRYYEEARKLASLISRAGRKAGHPQMVVVTGGGPGVMEAGNKGAQHGKEFALR
jgi:hypothetical protein